MTLRRFRRFVGPDQLERNECRPGAGFKRRQHVERIELPAIIASSGRQP
jgi:hypothetical protein